MMRFAAFIALACSLAFAGASPAAAGCVCKDPRGTWCAKNCYACFGKHATPAGYCSYWLDKRKQRRAKGAHS